MKTMMHSFCVLLVFFVSQATAADVQIQCLSIQEGRKAILDDHLEPYFSILQPMEMSAKTGRLITGDTLEQQRAQCRQRYVDGVRAFTEPEVAAITALINIIHPVMTEHFPQYATMPWKFIKLSDNIEGGMPHTRDHYIVMPEKMLQVFVASKAQVAANPLAAIPLIEILVHEQMHVFQRTHPGVMDDLYLNVWGMKKLTNIPGSAWLTKHQLTNPDGVDCSWALPDGENRYLWPLVALREGEGLKAMPEDFLLLAIDVVQKDGVATVVATGDNKPASKNLLQLQQFRNVFPMTQNIYHPNEAAASMFATLCTIDYFISRDMINKTVIEKYDPLLAPLRTWFGKHLTAQN